MLHRTSPTWPVAAGSLVAGFAVAQATGVRPLGGIVLALGCGWCALRWRERAGRGRAAGLVGLYLAACRAGTGRAAGLVGLYLAAFAGSHVLAHSIGAWPSVAVVSAVVAVGSYAVADAAAGRRVVSA